MSRIKIPSLSSTAHSKETADLEESNSPITNQQQPAIELKPKLAEAYMYRGVLYTEMGRKIDAQTDLAALQKLNPQLAKDLAEVIKTGKEEDRFYGLSSKIKG